MNRELKFFDNAIELGLLPAHCADYVGEHRNECATEYWRLFGKAGLLMSPQPIEVPRGPEIITNKQQYLKQFIFDIWLARCENRELTNSGWCNKYGIATLYLARALIRRERRALHVRGLCCKGRETPWYEVFERDKDHVKHFLSFLDGEMGTWADGRYPYHGGYNVLGWILQLTRKAVEENNVSLAARLSIYKWAKSAKGGTNQRSNLSISCSDLGGAGDN